MTYFRYIVYFFLSILDSTLNFLAAIVRFYPAVDMSGNYLARTEIAQLYGFASEEEDERMDYYEEAESLKQQAYQMIENDKH